jgi:hypothetical protein
MDIHFAGWFVWDSEPLTVGRAETVELRREMEWRKIRDKKIKDKLSLEKKKSYIEIKTRLESGVYHESG